MVHKMRKAELREHPTDFLTMGNLEHFAVVAGDLQWAEKSYFKKLMCKITDARMLRVVSTDLFLSEFC